MPGRAPMALPKRPLRPCASLDLFPELLSSFMLGCEDQMIHRGPDGIADVGLYSLLALEEVISQLPKGVAIPVQKKAGANSAFRAPRSEDIDELRFTQAENVANACEMARLKDATAMRGGCSPEYALV